MAASTRDEFDRRAATFERDSPWAVDATVAAAAASVISRARAHRMLDAGGGTGALSYWLRSQMRVDSTTVVDCSAAMLKQVDPNVETLCCLLEDLPESLGTFDVVLLRQVLHYLEDPPSTLRLLGSLLEAGGVLYLGQIVSPTPAAADWFRSTFSWMGTSRRHAWCVGSLSAGVEQCGYRIERLLVSPFEGSLNRFVERSQLGSQRGLSLKLKPEQVPAAIIDDLQIRVVGGEMIMTMEWFHAALVPASSPRVSDSSQSTV